MGWRISYNGFGNGTNSSVATYGWKNISIDNLIGRPVFANDGVSHLTTRHELSGTALISESTNTKLVSAIRECKARMSRQRKRLVVESLDSDDGGTPKTLVDITQADMTGEGSPDAEDFQDELNKTPYAEVDIEEITGAITAVVRFRFIWHDMQIVGGASGESDDYTVLSHTWQQQFDTSENGLSMRTVNGILHARQNKTASSSPFLGKNPDSYRGLIAPDIPDNFRITSQRYGTDVSGEKLLYTIEMREYARGLPLHAKDGDGQFTWSRSINPIQGSVIDAAGRKVFDAELEGDANTSPADLLADLVNASKKRITWSGAQADTILAIEVTEHDIFKNMRIGLRIEAIAIGNIQNTLDSGVQGLITTPNTPGFFLLQPFVDSGEVAEPPNPYGSPLVKAVRKALFQPWSTDNQSADTFDRAETEAATDGEQDTGDRWTEYVVTNEAFNNTDDPSPGGQDPPGGGDPNSPQPNSELPDLQFAYPYLKASGVETIEVIHHNGWLKPTSLSNEAPDIPYQFRRPTVRITSDYELVRNGIPPRRVFLSAPVGSLIKEESFHVATPKIDANNRKIFTGRFRRVIELGLLGTFDNEPGNPGFFTFTADLPSSLGQATYAFFAPPLNSLPRPFDPRTDKETYADETTPLIGSGASFLFTWDESGNTDVITTSNP